MRAPVWPKIVDAVDAEVLELEGLAAAEGEARGAVEGEDVLQRAVERDADLDVASGTSASTRPVGACVKRIVPWIVKMPPTLILTCLAALTEPASLTPASNSSW